MATFEEKQDLLDKALASAAQAQELGQVRLEQGFKRMEAAIASAGEAVAGAMKGSADQAAQAHLDALLKVVAEIATASRATVADAAQAIQGIRQSFQAEVQASQGVLKGVNAEADKASGLLAKMGEQGAQGAETLDRIRKDLVSLREEVGNHKVQLKDAIRQAEANAKEQLGELHTRIREATDYSVRRAYNLGSWWDRFTRIGIPAVLALFAAVSGGMGWWYGHHQVEEGIYGREFKALKANTEVIVYAHKFFPGPEQEVKHEIEQIQAPLEWLGGGKLALMKRNAEGQWVSEKRDVVQPGGSLSLAEAYDKTQDNKVNTIKDVRP
jgi:hypothetical protein